MGKKLPYIYNLKPGVEKDDDLLFHQCFEKNEAIPLNADLRSGYSGIKDQGKLGACTAFSAVSVIEYLLNKDIDLSELYFYYEERKEDGDVSEDAGSTITRSAEVATNIGTCKEVLDPYIIENFANTPSLVEEVDAKNHKAVTKYRLKTINDILYCVGVLKKPVLIGIKVYESFENVGSDGFVPMPKKGEELLGGHALNIAGYFWKTKDALKDIKYLLGDKNNYKGLYFIIRNSWGTDFGDKGYLYIPAEFIKKYSSDWWHIDIN